MGRIKACDSKEEEKEKSEHLSNISRTLALWFGEISTAGNNTLRCTGKQKKDVIETQISGC